jgi:hypothetical protein
MTRETPFQIKISPEQRKKLVNDLENVTNIKSAIHFIKNYKHCIIINKKFKRKVVNFSIKSVAGLSAIVMAMSLIKPKNDNTNKTIKQTPVETTVESKEETKLEPVLSPESIEEININKLEKEDIIPTQSLNMEEFGKEVTNTYEVTPSTKIVFPKASNTNEESDYTNYYKVKEKYGDYIEVISKESGVDSRLIIAMIAQENPDQIDESSYGTYGPMCVTTVHNGETYNYYHYTEDGEYVNDPVTININNLKHFSDNMELYEDGKYGNITYADAWCIYYGVVILKDNFYQVNKTNDLSKEENVPLAILAYNHGYPDIIHCTKYSSSLSDACYSVRYTHAYDVNYDDDQYLEHVLNKIPDEELDKPFTFTDNEENKITFNLERNNDLDNTSSEIIENKKSHLV